MIVAIPMDRKKDIKVDIIKEVDPTILTFPEFLDNFYVRYIRYRDLNFRKKFLRVFQKYINEVRVAIYPDYQYDLAWLLKKYSDKIWVFPLHKKEEIDFVVKHGFKWIGLPHRKKWRDYSIQEFIKITSEYGLKRWWLGWWSSRKFQPLHLFHGLDTTLPYVCAFKYGLIWRAPREKPRKAPKMNPLDRFRLNIENFSKFVKSLNISFTKWR